MSDNSNLHSIDKLLKNAEIFRIPDYQRGYAWQTKQCNDFWEDLKRIVENNDPEVLHYIGVISLQTIEWDSLKSKNEFSDKLEKLKKEEYKLFHIVDGQQRITTVIILLGLFLNSKFQLDKDTSNESYLKKLLFIYEDTFALYKFGYEADDPSFRFFKENIISMPEKWNDIGKLDSPLINTFYTNNLQNAKKFFAEKIEDLLKTKGEKEVKKYFDALRLRFVGIKNVINKNLNIYMIFETMNSRGIDLSNMELLKNRLIYLSTLLPKEKTVGENLINEAWKIIYKFLGFNINNSLSDDEFLRNHWIMYQNYSRREEEFYKNDLLSNVFIVQNINHSDPEKEVSKKSIEKYVNSLQISIGKWFIMHDPNSDHIKRFFTAANIPADEKNAIAGFDPNWEKIKSELLRTNRLGMRYFEPLVLAAFLEKENIPNLPKLLQTIERFIFLSFYISMRRSDYGSSTFYPLARDLYHAKIIDKETDTKTNLAYAISIINQWSNSSIINESNKYDMESFIVYIKDLFQRDITSGFRNWNGIHYFLQEYENRLRDKNKLDLISDAYSRADVEFIASYVKSGRDNENVDKIIKDYKKKEHWKDYSKDQVKKILCSLGNLTFAEEKDIVLESRKELAKWKESDEMTPSGILKRGLHLLKFMEERWAINLGDINDKKKILFLEFM